MNCDKNQFFRIYIKYMVRAMAFLKDIVRCWRFCPCSDVSLLIMYGGKNEVPEPYRVRVLDAV